MKLFLTIEAQKTNENGLSDILKDVNKSLSFVTNRNSELENVNNYGTEFRLISIIPICVDDRIWEALGWKERRQIWRKKQEADIRLRMDYNRFIHETLENKRLMFIDIVIKSINVVESKSLGDFSGKKLIADILKALNVTYEQLDKLNTY